MSKLTSGIISLAAKVSDLLRCYSFAAAKKHNNYGNNCMYKSARGFGLAIIFPIMIASAPASRGEEVLRLRPGVAKSVVVDAAEDGKFASIIGNPRIADVTFGPKNTFWFVGLTEGTTNIIVLDTNTGKEMYSALIKVRDPNLVHVHNMPLVTSYKVYRCDPTCEYIKDIPEEEPAALTTGNSQTRSDSTIRSTSSGTGNQSGETTIQTTIRDTTSVPALAPR